MTVLRSMVPLFSAFSSILAHLVSCTTSSSRNSSTGKVKPGMWIIGHLSAGGWRGQILSRIFFPARVAANFLLHCPPKYLENFSALRVALMRMTLRSSRRLSRSFTMMSNTSDCRFLSWISSSTRWLMLDRSLSYKNKDIVKKMLISDPLMWWIPNLMC